MSAGPGAGRMSDSHVQTCVLRLPVSEQERDPRAAVIWGAVHCIALSLLPMFGEYIHTYGERFVSVGSTSSDSANHGLKYLKQK